jgi:hypothetical protein
MTQQEQVLKHLKRFKKITSWGAIKKYNITRLSAYICNLRNEGYNIKSTTVVKNNAKRGTSKVFTEYSM